MLFAGDGGREAFILQQVWGAAGAGRYLGQKETIGFQKWAWNVHEMIITRADRNLRELQVQVLF